MPPFPLNASIIWIIVSIVLGLLLLPVRRRIETSQFELIELIRWLVLPYLALLTGQLSLRLMGLTVQNWQTTFGIGLGVCFGLLVLVSIARVTNSNTGQAPVEHIAQSQFDYAATLLEQTQTAKFNLSEWLWKVSHAIAHEFHWTFLRAGIWEAILQLEALQEVPAYTAIWSAGAIAFIEIAIHRRGKTQWIWQLTALLLTSVLFFYSQNFYLCALLHASFVMIMPNAITTAPNNLSEAHLRIESQLQSSQQISGLRR